MKRLGFVIIYIIFSSYLLQGQIISGEVLIQFKHGVSSSQQDMVIKEYELSILRNLSTRLSIWHCLINDNQSALAKAAALQNNEYVLFAQPNHKLELRETIPDDEFFGLQWCHQNTGQQSGIPDADIDATEVWDYLPGGVTAQGDTIVLAIVDNGTDLDHPDLNFFKNELEIPANGIDDDNNGYIDDYDGWNAYSHTGNPSSGSHGAHVCGIAAARGNNNLGVCGVNWEAKLMPVAGSSTSEATVVEAYGYILEMRSLYNETAGEQGALVVASNASFGVNYGQPEDFPIWSAMYDSLGMAGILSMGATANANWNIDEVGDIPTACPSEWLITVTNTTPSDNKYISAGYGLETIDLGAPGTAIYSTDTNTAGYSYKTGTSMATPQVCGAAGLLYSALPAVALREYRERPAELALMIRDAILLGVDPLPDLDGITVSGGRLNLYNSLQSICCGAYGDVNNDEMIDSYDGAQILQYFVGMEPSQTPLPWEIWRQGRADVDGNGYIEAYDCSLIIRYSLGMIDVLPIEE